MTTSTTERRVARLFGLSGDSWMRHANPVSVWTRYAVLPLLVVAIWSRDWIGWWSLLAVLAVLAFMMINPMLFPPPRSTRNWASKGVFGERIWADRDRVELPDSWRRTRAFAVSYAFQFAGVAVLAYGLIRLDLAVVIAGTLLTQCAKSWFIDRMVLLFEDMKKQNAEYAAWEF